MPEQFPVGAVVRFNSATADAVVASHFGHKGYRLATPSDAIWVPSSDNMAMAFQSLEHQCYAGGEPHLGYFQFQANGGDWAWTCEAHQPLFKPVLLPTGRYVNTPRKASLRPLCCRGTSVHELVEGVPVMRCLACNMGWVFADARNHFTDMQWLLRHAEAAEQALRSKWEHIHKFCCPRRRGWKEMLSWSTLSYLPSGVVAIMGSSDPVFDKGKVGRQARVYSQEHNHLHPGTTWYGQDAGQVFVESVWDRGDLEEDSATLLPPGVETPSAQVNLRVSGAPLSISVSRFLQEYRPHPIRFKLGSVVRLGEEIGDVTKSLMLEQSVEVHFDSGAKTVPENYLEDLGSTYTRANRVCYDYFF